MKIKVLVLALTTITALIGTADWAADFPLSRSLVSEWQWGANGQSQPLLKDSILDERETEAAFRARSLAIREKVAAADLEGLDTWWRTRTISDPHKYLLPVILARLSLGNQYDRQQIWDILLGLEEGKPDIYHFRSPYDIRIFFLFRNTMPQGVKASYHSMLDAPRVREWLEQGTENHMFMQRVSGLALMDGSGLPTPLPATAATNESWLRAELNKFLTIGQGEFHSSTYYGYAIAGLLNLYDFADTPELRQLAKAALDWYAVNMAVRFSWGTAGGAESRGFDRGTWDDSGLSGVAWMWWGDSLAPVERMDRGVTRVALPAALSEYRPPPQLRAIARKEIELPFQLKASHPGYYSYHQDNRFWETFYVTPDYSLGTLIDASRSYQVKGTINAQYATYKLVVRDPQGQNNAVISLGGTYHSAMATGRSPGDQYVQEKGAVMYQLRLNARDQTADVPGRSHLVLPTRYGKPQRYKNWYIWRIENTFLCARPWGEQIDWKNQVSEKYSDYQVLAAIGSNTAWITDVASVEDYPTIEALQQALDQTEIRDASWQTGGEISYTSLAGDRLQMTYQPNRGAGLAQINGKERVLGDWAVLDSPYVQQDLNSGLLEIFSPQGNWRLRATLTGFEWEYD